MSIIHNVDTLSYKTFDSTWRAIDLSYETTATNCPIIFLCHGFSGSKNNITTEIKERFIGYGFVTASITMRKDAGAYEVLDFWYAFDFVRKLYYAYTSDVFCICGYSGGGGNTYSAFTKLPDLFNYAIVHFGMSDYETWYNEDTGYQSIIESYVGGDPVTYPDKYAARSALDAIVNCLITPKMWIFHDENDSSVPVAHADNWSTAGGSLNITYTKTTALDDPRAIHGYPIVGTVGEPNIDFEATDSPTWAIQIISDIAGASVPARTLPSTGTLSIRTFIRTNRFFVLLTDNDVCSLDYTAADKLTIDNTDTSNNITIVTIEWYGKSSLSKYQIDRTDENTAQTTTTYANTDYHGKLSITDSMRADDLISWEITDTLESVQNMSALIMSVKTDNTGSSNDDEFVPALISGATYNCTITGSFTGSPLTQTTDVSPTLVFPGGAGTYDVEFTENVPGGMPGFKFNNGGDCQKVIDISQWGTCTLRADQDYAFYGCSNMGISATDYTTADWDSITNATYMFYGCTGITGAITLPNMPALLTVNSWMRNCTGITSLKVGETSLCQNFNNAFRSMSALKLINFDMRAMNNGTGTFIGVTLASQSYTDLLIALATNNVNTSIAFWGGNSKYYNYCEAYRNILTVDRSWTITDGGIDPSRQLPFTSECNIGISCSI